MFKNDFFTNPFYELEENCDACKLKVTATMGSDDDIAEAARQSFNAGRGPRKSTNEALIGSLLKRGHDTPFEQCEIRFRLKAPEFVWKQWLRHRIASINEISLRYSKDVVLEFYEPKVWRDAKGNPLPDDVQRMLSENLRQNHETYRKIYQWRLDNGVALEQARIDMPMTRITDAWWKCNLREAIHFMTLRGDERAQLEIRRYARRMCDELSKPFPVAMTAFREICVDPETSR